MTEEASGFILNKTGANHPRVKLQADAVVII
jgi:hypothetical protein